MWKWVKSIFTKNNESISPEQDQKEISKDSNSQITNNDSNNKTDASNNDPNNKTNASNNDQKSGANSHPVINEFLLKNSAVPNSDINSDINSENQLSTQQDLDDNQINQSSLNRYKKLISNSIEPNDSNNFINKNSNIRIQNRIVNGNHHQQQFHLDSVYNEDDQNQPLSREDRQRQKICQETMEVLRTGKYPFYDKKQRKVIVVDIKKFIESCCLHSETIRPDQTFDSSVTQISNDSFNAQIEVTNESTFQAAYRLKTQEGIKKICILNSASAIQPGGGFLNGREGQEETLSRQSALYFALLYQQEMYDYNKSNDNNYFYSDYMIYSPNVPFFRDDNYQYIKPFSVNVISSPAVNYADLMMSGNIDPSFEEKISDVMKIRCKKILDISISKGNKAIVLGAFGCDTFKMPPDKVSGIFNELLFDQNYANYFDKVVFPIPSKNIQESNNTFEVFKNNLEH